VLVMLTRETVAFVSFNSNAPENVPPS